MIILFAVVFAIGAAVMAALDTAVSMLGFNCREREEGLSKFNFLFVRCVSKIFPGSAFYRLGNTIKFLGLSLLLGYAVTITVFLARYTHVEHLSSLYTAIAISVFIVIAMAVVIAIFGVLFMFARSEHVAALKLFFPIALIYLILFFPLVYPIIWMSLKVYLKFKSEEPKLASDKLKKRLMELLKEPELESVIDPKDKKLVRAIAQFGGLSAREIMIPRVDIVAVSEDVKVFDAFSLFVKEGYSRIPVFSGSIDNITGVLLYKDLMGYIYERLGEGVDVLRESGISSIATKILYAPENKNVRDLFQEIKSQKIHVVTIVNEYGCTEGIVTTEDIIEEIIGSEILDEHDEIEDVHFQKVKDRSWVVDAKMTIVDAEREFGITIPHKAEYETLSGFVSWRTGGIPKAGTRIVEDGFTIEIMSADTRQINQVQVTTKFL